MSQLRTAIVWSIAILLTAAGCRRTGNDLLIMRDGTTQRGTLERCTEELCQMDGRSIPRPAIHWIGLEEQQQPPPAVRDPARNELHLANGGVRSTTLFTLDSRTVSTDDTPYPRKQVRWIYLVPPVGSAGPDGESASEERSYLWDGTIEVTDEYTGMNGSHEWKGEFRGQFLEERNVKTGGFTSLTPSGDLDTFYLLPLAVSYNISARQNYDRGYYQYEDLKMNGHASGSLPASLLKDGNFAKGTVLTFDAPVPAKYNGSTSFDSRRAADEFRSSEWADRGGYELWIYLKGDFTEDRNPAEEARAERALYRGINKTGKLKFGVDPNRDFLHYVRLEGMHVAGRLEHPEQTEVSGEFSYPSFDVGTEEDDPGRVTVRWHFQRKPR